MNTITEQPNISRTIPVRHYWKFARSVSLGLTGLFLIILLLNWLSSEPVWWNGMGLTFIIVWLGLFFVPKLKPCRNEMFKITGLTALLLLGGEMLVVFFHHGLLSRDQAWSGFNLLFGGGVVLGLQRFYRVFVLLEK